MAVHLLLPCADGLRGSGGARPTALCRYALIADTFSPENGILTAALKLKRPVAVQVHKEVIDEIYAAKQGWSS